MSAPSLELWKPAFPVILNFLFKILNSFKDLFLIVCICVG